MKIIKLSILITAISLFLMACNTQQQPQQTSTADTNANNAMLTAAELDTNEYVAKDNLDLERIGNLLERSNSPQEFEAYLNSYDGINNLDLNGDGYVDYISVDEFQDRDDYERGLSLYTRYGPDEVQELGSVVFYRDDNRSPGARVLLTGNEQIYGDNYRYETNWLDRSLGIVSALFGQRETSYRSPYYYNNYPSNYQTYQVVERPYYVSRVQRLYPQPLFVYTTDQTYFKKVKIKSPHYGKWMNKVYAKLAKPTKEQEEFIMKNPKRPKPVKEDKAGKPDDKGGKKDDNGKKDDRKAEDKDDKQPKAGKDDDKKEKSPKGKNEDKGKGKKPE